MDLIIYHFPDDVVHAPGFLGQHTGDLKLEVMT
jgi:hypothetical protein